MTDHAVALIISPSGVCRYLKAGNKEMGERRVCQKSWEIIAAGCEGEVLIKGQEDYGSV